MSERIRVSKSVRELKGNFKELPVKPFGTSGHIIIPKNDVGKIVGVIIPEEDVKLFWLFSEGEKEDIIRFCKENVLSEGGAMASIRLETIENFEKSVFPEDDFLRVLGMLKRYKYDMEQLEKIEREYGFDD